MDNDYERLRQENIRRNEQLMRELQVLGGGSAMGGPGTSKAKAKAAPKKQGSRRSSRSSTNAQPKPRPPPPRPTRTSARLRGVTAESPGASNAKEGSVAPVVVQDTSKEAPEGDLSLSDLGGGQLREAQIAALKAAFTRAAVQGDEAAAEEKGAPLSTDEKELNSIFSKMELRAGDKVTPKRVYSMVFHPGDDDLIFVGDNEGTIGVWQPLAKPPKEEADDDGEEDQEDSEGEQDALPTGSTYFLPGSHGRSAVTCLKFDPVSADSLYSSSYDSSIRVLSLADQISRPVWQGDGDALFSSFEILAPSTHAAAFTHTPHPAMDERQLWLADHKGGLVHIDLREQKAQGSTRRWQVAEKKIGALSVNPANPSVLATASLDQHVRLFDVRKVQSLEEVDVPYRMSSDLHDVVQDAQDKAQLGSFKTRYAFTSVDFSPLGNHLAGVSYDDWISVWNFGKPAALTSDVKPEHKDNPLADPTRKAHNTQTGRWVTPLKALWNRNPDVPAHFSIGGMHHRAEIYSADGTLLRDLYDSTYITAVPAVTAMHPRIPGRVATGNGSGKCFFWA